MNDEIVNSALKVIFEKIIEVFIEKVIGRLSPQWLMSYRKRIRTRRGIANQIHDQITDRIASKQQLASVQCIDLKVENEYKQERLFSQALKKSREQLIILEGEPGAGKSFLLSNYALQLADKAVHANRPNSLLPVYVDLRELKREEHNNAQTISASLIENVVFKTLNPKQDSSWLETLRNALDSRSWLIIFDSFDEIPDILQSTPQDDVVQQYVDAIRLFLNQRSNCKGVIASRHYKGPERSGWSRLKILPLEEKQKIKFIQSSGLSNEQSVALLTDLENSNVLKNISKNPLFLNILCDNLVNGKPLPKSVHVAYEDFVDHRLHRDAEQILKLFRRTSKELKSACQMIAFYMTSKGLGLNPKRSELIEEITAEGVYHRVEIENLLNAIVHTNLGYYSNQKLNEKDPNFSFIHRRMQEYFASCLLMDEMRVQGDISKITPHELLTLEQWREVAVTIFQIQEKHNLAHLYEKVEEILLEESMKIKVDLEQEYDIQYTSSYLFKWLKVLEKPIPGESIVVQFSRSNYFLHVLSILQEGLINRVDDIPENIMMIIKEMITLAFRQNSMQEKMYALAYCDLLPVDIREEIFSFGMSVKDQDVKNLIYENATKLPQLPKEIHLGIVKQLIETVTSGRYQREKIATRAYLQRLPNPSVYLKILRRLMWLPIVDVVFLLIPFIFFVFAVQNDNPSDTIKIGLVYVGFVLVSAYFLVVQYQPALYKYNTINDIIKQIIYPLRLLSSVPGAFLMGILGIYTLGLLFFGQSPEHTSDWVFSAVRLIFASGLTVFISMFLMAIPLVYYYLEKHGKMLHPLLWFFSPLIVILHAPINKIKKVGADMISFRSTMQNIQHKTGLIFKARQKILAELTFKKISIFSLLSVLLLISLLLVLFMIWEATESIAMTESWQTIFPDSDRSSLFASIPADTTTYIMVGFIVVFGLFVLAAFIYGKRKTNKFLASHQSSMDICEFASTVIEAQPKEILSLFWSGNHVIDIVIKEKGLLNPTEEAKSFVQTLSVLIQNTRNLDAEFILYKPRGRHQADPFNQWLESFQDEYKLDLSIFSESSMAILRDWALSEN